MLQEILLEQVTERQRHIELVRKWGEVNTEGLLAESCLKFSIPEVEGFIGYRIESANAVVCGEPVCAPENKLTLAKAFQEFCNAQHHGVIYTIVSQDFAEKASFELAAVTIEFGVKYILDPHINSIKNKGSKAALLRKKVRHALKDGITIHEYHQDEDSYALYIEKHIENVALSWQQKRQGAKADLSNVNIFNNRLGKRWFYAKRGERIIGFLMLSQLETKNGWLLNNIMATQNAPNGLAELLIISTLQVLEREGCHYVLAGPDPSKALGEIRGISNAWAMMTRRLFKCAQYIFHLHGYYTFWDKFLHQTESSYLVFPQKNFRYSSIKALIRSYNVNVG